MTSVPKPLKFMRPHYAKMKQIYMKMADGPDKVSLQIAEIFNDFVLI